MKPDGVKWLESVRKDVECTFGILKGRFRCLKLPIFYHSKKNIDNMFFTCCILHNMLLSNNGFDRRWEDGCNILQNRDNNIIRIIDSVFSSSSSTLTSGSPLFSNSSSIASKSDSPSDAQFSVNVGVF